MREIERESHHTGGYDLQRVDSAHILSHAIDLRALCGAKLVTYPADFRGNETLALHHVGPDGRQRGDLQRVVSTREREREGDGAGM